MEDLDVDGMISIWFFKN